MTIKQLNEIKKDFKKAIENLYKINDNRQIKIITVDFEYRNNFWEYIKSDIIVDYSNLLKDSFNEINKWFNELQKTTY